MKVNRNFEAGVVSILTLGVLGFVVVLSAVGLILPNIQKQSEVAEAAIEERVITLSPLEDSYVASNNKTANFGSSRTLLSGENSRYTTYFKFDFSSVKGKKITSAKFKLKSSISPSGSQEMKIVTNNNWKEGTINYNNKPSVSNTVFSFTPAAKDTWATVDLNQYISVIASMPNTVSFAITSSGSRSAGFYSKESADKPVFEFTHVVEVANATPRPTFVPGPTVTPRPSSTSTVRPTITASPRPTATPTLRPSTSTPPTIAPTVAPVSGSGTIFGAVSADILGNCSGAVHDRYVVRGPDNQLYRTWHPITVSNGSGGTCSFAHEHGDDPTTSVVDRSLPPFGYIARQAGMDEPHVGFKIFVANQGVLGNSGTALNSSRIVFHMGTGGAARFTARFHSLEFDALSREGYKMALQGLADTGEVGTICGSRVGKTVMGLGCSIESSYEIWENTLRITNQGKSVVTAITSSAVFDAITVMDPADKAKLLYVWSPEAQARIFVHDNDRTSARGCKREAYHGPLAWSNQGGASVYYTDAYGVVTNGGPLKQEITPVTFSGWIGTIKTSNGEKLTQFSLASNHCASSLGVKN